MSSLASEGDILWPLADHLGTTNDLAQFDGDDTTIASHRRFDTFGKLFSQSDSDFQILFKFTGRPYDDSTDLNNNVNRWYAFGIWLSEDPIGFASGDPNSDRYVNNAPTMNVDPDGLKVYLKSHHVSFGWYHLSIIVIPDNQQLYANESRFTKNADGFWMMTLGAEPIKSPLPSNTGCMVTRINYKADMDFTSGNAAIVEIPLPKKYKTEDEWIVDLYQGTFRFSIWLNYDLFPAKGTDGYNSNSFVSGLLLLTGCNKDDVRNLSGAFDHLSNFSHVHPGVEKPVPAEHYEEKPADDIYTVPKTPGPTAPKPPPIVPPIPPVVR